MIFTNNFYILSTLGLTGGWCYLPESKQKMLFSKNIDDYSKYLSDTKINAYLQRSLKHLNVEFKTINGSIYYFDTLSFGTLKCVTNVDELNKILSKIGPDIMDVSTTIAIFIERIKQNKNINKCIGVVLMNQKVISGIGNYLRSDILYISQIDPFRTVGSLDDSEIKEIFSNCKILTWGSYNIKKGIELKIIKKNTKLPADYNRLFFIYNQKLDMYGNDIIKKELYEGSKKRFIYYVPNIQK